MIKVYNENIKKYDYENITSNIYKLSLRENIIENNDNGIYKCDEYISYISFEIDEDYDNIETYIEENFDDLIEKERLNEKNDNKNNNIKILKDNLINSDYKIIKSFENFMINNTVDSDFSNLISNRTEARNEINLLDGTINNNEENLLELEKSKKIKEMNSTSKYLITNGIDIGNNHYTLNEYDQINIITLGSLAQQGKCVPYHASGQNCRIYQPEEMIELLTQATNWITYHTTYVNLIKSQINSLSNIEEVKNCYYGMDLNPEYQEIINSITHSL